MKTRNNILYPLAELKEFLETDIYQNLNKFYSAFENELFGHRIKSIDRQNHLIEFYKDSYLEGESGIEKMSFAKSSKAILLLKVNKTLLQIITGFEGCITFSQPYSSYGNRILNQLQELKGLPSYTEFRFIPECLELIEEEVKHYLEPENIGDENEIYKKSPFSVKTKYRRKFFNALYDIALIHSIIDLEFSKESFIEVFTAVNTNIKLKFICNNTLMITFIEGIKDAFEDLKPLEIGKSERFLTKQDNILSATNYDTSKDRVKTSSKVIDLQEDLNYIISSQE